MVEENNIYTSSLVVTSSTQDSGSNDDMMNTRSNFIWQITIAKSDL